MGGYGSGRKTRHLSTSDCHIIDVKEAHEHNIALTYTEQSGAVPGRRAWMLCPYCSSRVGKLYLSRINSTRPACRTCLQLNYDSQRLPYEEKQRTYEIWLLEQGYFWTHCEWWRMPYHVLTLEEAKYYMHIGNCRRTSHFMKLMIRVIRLHIKMEKSEKKREKYEKKAKALEKRTEKYRKKKATIHQIYADMKAASNAACKSMAA